MIKSIHSKSWRFKAMEYADWINSNWNKAGGLITQAQAAKILKRTRGRITQMFREKKLTPYQYEKEAPLVSFAEVSRILEEHK